MVILYMLLAGKEKESSPVTMGEVGLSSSCQLGNGELDTES